MGVGADGSLTDREIFGPTRLGAFFGFPDRIAFDALGNLWGGLSGDRIPYFRSPPAGLPMVHWGMKSP